MLIPWQTLVCIGTWRSSASTCGRASVSTSLVRVEQCRESAQAERRSLRSPMAIPASMMNSAHIATALRRRLLRTYSRANRRWSRARAATARHRQRDDRPAMIVMPRPKSAVPSARRPTMSVSVKPSHRPLGERCDAQEAAEGHGDRPNTISGEGERGAFGYRHGETLLQSTWRGGERWSVRCAYLHMAHHGIRR